MLKRHTKVVHNLITLLIYSLLILSITKLPEPTHSYLVCTSINIQGGTFTLKHLNKIRNCNIIIGNIRILNANFNISSNNSSSFPTSLFFPHLTEITDYLLIFQVHNLPNLHAIFPKLRGHNARRSPLSRPLLTGQFPRQLTAPNRLAPPGRHPKSVSPPVATLSHVLH